MKKRVLLALMVIMLGIIAFGAISVSADTYGNFTYEIYSDEVCITRFENIDATGTISIPSSIKGYPVTQIESYAFMSCSKITGVSIPSTVWYMGTGVFTWCESLKSVTIPAGVERFLDADTFYGCSSLTGISVSSANPNYSSVNGVLYSKDKTALLAYPQGKTATSFSVPSTVTSISSGAFSGCSQLKSISLPNGLQNISSDVFSGCSGLTEIKIPSSVTNIATDAFGGCSGISRFEVDNANSAYMSIDGVLYTKDKKTLLNYPLGKTDTIFHVPTGVNIISSSAFAYEDNLMEISLPDGLTEIGTEAFYYCDALKTINIPVSIKKISTNAFRYASAISKAIYDGTESEWAQVTVNSGNTTLKNKIVFQKIYVSIYEDEIQTKKVKIDAGSVFPSSLIYQKEGYTVKLYSDSNYTTSFSQSSILTKDTDIYIKYIPYNLNKFEILGVESANIGAFGIIQYTAFATDKDVNTLYSFIKYPDCLTLKSVIAKDFAYAEKEDEYTENGYTTAVILAQYSDTELIPENVIHTPFELVFDVSKTAIPGTVQIEATEDTCLIGNDTYFFEDRFAGELEITPKLAESIMITGDDVISSETTYIATVLPDYTTNKEVEWSVDDENIATVSENGVVIPVTSGTFTLTATAKDGSGMIATKLITVTRFVESIEIAGADSINEATAYYANVLPDYATNKEIEWSIDNEEIATIDENGLVIPVTSGLVVITVTAKDGSGVSATKEITVVKLAESIEITGEDSISSPAQYVAAVLPDYTSDKEVEWSVDNESIATVDELGIVTPVTSGTIVLTAAAKDGSGVFATKTVEIIAYAQSIEIVGDEEITEPSQYSVVILPDYTTNKNAHWSVSDKTVATVDENGLVTPLKNGKIVLTATAEDESGVSTTKSIVITVNVRANFITSDTGTWNKEFDSDFTEYIIYVNKDVTSVYLTSSFNDATAKVNGSLAANGIRKKVTLTGQETVVEIVLTPTAGNELQANTYTITIIRGSYTKTTVSEDRKTVMVNPVNIPNGMRVILALYDSGKLTETQNAVYAGEEITFTTTKPYTNAKVMVWDDLTNLMPVCDLEYIE